MEEQLDAERLRFSLRRRLFDAFSRGATTKGASISVGCGPPAFSGCACPNFFPGGFAMLLTAVLFGAPTAAGSAGGSRISSTFPH